MTLQYGIISPQDWGFSPATALPDTLFEPLGISLTELEARARHATYGWLLRQFDEAIGAFYGHYRAPDRYLEPPQTTNLIAPWQLLAAYDRYGDAVLLEKAVSAAEWFYKKHIVDHPMAVVAGGVRDGVATEELWTKFTAEEIVTCLGVFSRTGDERWLSRAVQSGRFLIQARRHGYAPRYHLRAGEWLKRGWDSWGRVVQANILLWQVAGGDQWLHEAQQWAEHGLAIQGKDGAFYLIDGEYYNTDLAADELRALTMTYEITGEGDFLRRARRFADWHLDQQLGSGAWPLTLDRDGNVVVSTVGPGDVPNIAIALLRLHHVTQEARYLDAASRAICYSLSMQAVPESNHPFTDDDRVRWGFWSWDPYYDYTMSGDQSTHHARGMWFLLDYWQAFLNA